MSENKNFLGSLEIQELQCLLRLLFAKPSVYLCGRSWSRADLLGPSEPGCGQQAPHPGQTRPTTISLPVLPTQALSIPTVRVAQAVGLNRALLGFSK